MTIRGIRGATTATKDDPEAILEATKQLLLAICKANPTLRSEDIASAMFTLSSELKSVYPARARRFPCREGYPSAYEYCCIGIH